MPNTANQLGLNTDDSLATQLYDEAQKLERSFALHSWQYSQLDGGRFCEVVSRILLFADSGTLPKDSMSIDDCLKHIEDNKKTHLYSDRKSLLHITKIVRSAYRLRSQRGSIHISSGVSADEIDSQYVLMACRWMLAEILRLFGDTTRPETIKLFSSLSRRPATIIRSFDGLKLVQCTTFRVAEEILVYLFFSDSAVTYGELCSSIPRDNSGIKKALNKMSGASMREVVNIKGAWQLTDIGIRHAEELIAGVEAQK